MLIGIDKLSFITQEFNVESMSCFTDYTLANSPKISKGNEIQPKLLTTIKGEKYHSHTNAMKLINIGTDQQIVVVLSGAKGENPANGNLQVTFNPSKYALGGYNLLNSTDILGDVYSDVSQTLKENGFNLNVESSRVQRIDITKQAEMPRMARDYMSAYDFLQVKYARDITRTKVNSDYYRLQPNTKKSSWQVCAYDKEMSFLSMAETPTAEKKLSRVEIQPTKLLRNELRFMRQAPCKEFAFSRVGQTLYSVDQWDYIYSSFLQKRMFNKIGQGVQLELPFNTEIQSIIEFESQQAKRGLFDRVLKHYGLPTILKYMSVDDLLSLFSLYYNKTQLNDLKNQVGTLIKNSPAFRSKDNFNGSLIAELQHHFISPNYIKKAV